MIDVETTGLSPGHHHRVVEVAVVRVERGRPAGEYVTLVNPERDLGDTNIHGITGRDVIDAPQFGEIAGDVVHAVGDRIVAGHNVRFDLSFLGAELRRLGHSLPPIPRICTLRLAALLKVPTFGRKLADCCAHFAVPHDGVHSALGDARATAHVLVHYLALAEKTGYRTLESLGCETSRAPGWPLRLHRSGKSLCRTAAAKAASAKNAYLARLVGRLPAASFEDGDELAYVELLDRVLEDRRITAEEAGDLIQVAADWGLSSKQVAAVHNRYLDDLVSAALDDGVITAAERGDLVLVAELVGISRRDLDSRIKSDRSDGMGTSIQKTESLRGSSVCFTGTLRSRYEGEPVTREEAHSLARAKGLVVKDSVTKDLDLLVVADPDSLSGKARKARAQGIRILAESVFWKLIGVDVV